MFDQSAGSSGRMWRVAGAAAWALAAIYALAGAPPARAADPPVAGYTFVQSLDGI